MRSVSCAILKSACRKPSTYLSSEISKRISCPFMHVLVNCKHQNDPTIKNERKWRYHFSNYNSMGIFSDTEGQVIQRSLDISGRFLKRVRYVMHALVTGKYEKNQTNSKTRKSGDTISPL